KCFVCPSGDARIDEPTTRTAYIHCQVCGEYQVTLSAAPDLRELDSRVKPSVSRWLHDQSAAGTITKGESKDIDFLASLKPLPFEERANRVLLFLAKLTDTFGRPLHPFACPEFQAIGESFKHENLSFILEYLAARNFVQAPNDGSGTAHLTGE